MTTTYTTDLLEDIPLLVHLLRQLQLDRILETHMGTHGNTCQQMQLGNGLATVIWLVYLLSAGDHRKVVVAEWVARHAAVLSAALGTPVSAADFSDDRLSTLLNRLQRPSCWPGIEEALFGRMLTVYAPGVERLHLDATTAYGYHTPEDAGLMRFGFAKSGTPPGLAQVKLMAATTARGQLVACTVAPGHTADSPLYTPLIARVRRHVGPGHLYVGDSKMAPMAIRTDLVTHGDTYLVPLPRTETGGDPAAWLAHAADTGQATTLLWREEPGDRPPTLLGGVWETTRTLTTPAVTWEERVLLVYSAALARKQEATLARHLTAATQALRALTPPPRRGRKQYRTEAALQAAITAILRRAGVEGLLQVTWQVEPGTGRTPDRWVITEVTRERTAIAARHATLGWRVMGTNADPATLSATDALLAYREEYVVERFFHVLKDQPVGLRPLWVRTDDQLRGLAYLLTLAARVLTYLEHRLQDALTAAGETLCGLHPGQSHIQTDHPTAKRVLEAITRAHPTRVGVATPDGQAYHVLNLPPVLGRILHLLDLPEDAYTRLTNTS
jgi:transposase